MTKEAPFGALLGALSVVVGALFVAGFSYRWSYYYNFGLNHMLFSFSLEAVLISAIELLRRPMNALLTVGIVASALLLVQGAIFGVGAAASLIRLDTSKKRDAQPRHGARLAIDAIRALALIYAAFLAGNIVGWRTFQEHRVDGPGNSLPRITLALGSASEAFPEAVLCNRDTVQERVFLGSATTLKRLDEKLGGCSGAARTWRLLYQDEHYVYIFAAMPSDPADAAGRPITMAVPRRDDLLMILN